MLCDNCGKDTKKYGVKRPDGKVWCYKCAKAEKYPSTASKRTRSKDAFIKHARQLCDLAYSGSPLSISLMVSGSKRSYTNGHVLISEMKETPEKYKLLSVDTLQEMGGEYPSIGGLASMVTNRTVSIPEEFYDYLKAFSKPKPRRGEVLVVLKRDGIEVIDNRDDSVMTYQEGTDGMKRVFPKKHGESINLEYRYMLALKPSKLSFAQTNKPMLVKHSYDEVIDALPLVLLMPRGR